MEMKKRLYDASLEGDVSTLKKLIQEDPLILERSISLTSFNETPLHVAALRGHLHFTRALLSQNPNLATEPDSLGRLPLHLTAAKGHLDITRELLRLGPSSACLSRDKDGMTPLMVVLMKGGQVEVVRELTRACPESTRVRGDRGESVYHLCVKYNNLEALKVLVEELGDGNDNAKLLNAGDDDGNTVFHLAALHKHLEIIKYLQTRPDVKVNAVNKKGLTALNLIKNSPRDLKGLEILNFLLLSNAQRAINSSSSPPSKISRSRYDARQRATLGTKFWKQIFTFGDKSNLEGLRGALFIGSALIVAIAVLPILNMNSNGPILDEEYAINTSSLVPALSIMLLLVSGLPLRNNFCVWLVMQLMYIAVGSLGWNFVKSIVTNGDGNRHVHLNNSTLVFMCILFGLLVMVTILNTIRLIALLMTSITSCIKKRKLDARREHVSSTA